MCRTATRVSSVNRSVSDGMGNRAIVSLLLIHHRHLHLPVGLLHVLLASGSGLGIACSELPQSARNRRCRAHVASLARESKLVRELCGRLGGWSISRSRSPPPLQRPRDGL